VSIGQIFFFEKLGFQDKIVNKETIIFIPCKVLGDFKANKVRETSPMTEKLRRGERVIV